MAAQANLRGELLRSEEERLRVSKALVEVKSENKKLQQEMAREGLEKVIT